MYINTFTPVMPRSNVCINCKIYIRRKNCANVRISLFLEMYLLFARRREETLSGDSRVLEKKKKKVPRFASRSLLSPGTRRQPAKLGY